MQRERLVKNVLYWGNNRKIMNMNDGSMIENKDRYTLTGYLKTKTFGSFASLF